ncbi:hypothetical protein DICVIV_03775 [Dictyocaulus viviparus]|uniref:Uncharacterized protein n=1 Tax=Dictyocaulus viviparus TaxID=29172 RepID=A0A0D8Y1X8_DICVI|nr:hypothetical protein DICVIV_03775 [Dictyocaulus viviparus]
MEPAQKSSVRCIQSSRLQQKPILRMDAVVDKKEVAAIPQIFSAATSRAMNSRLARNRTTSESALIHGKQGSTPLVLDQKPTKRNDVSQHQHSMTKDEYYWK